MILPQAQILIRTLRARSPSRDRLGLRSRLMSSLSAADLHPRNLKPNSILFVRQVNAPHPYRPRVAEQNPGWSEKVLQDLEQDVRAAYRPARGGSAGGASAVLFEDEAELLAAMARDSLLGLLWARWWWRSFPGMTASSRSVALIWLKHARFIPAALVQLVNSRHADDFIKSLSPDETLNLILAIAPAGIFKVFHTARHAVATIPPPLPRASPPLGDELTLASNATHSEIRRQAPFWQYVPLPTLNWSPLSIEHELLLGLGLMLHLAPHRINTTQFLDELVEWLADRNQVNLDTRLPDRSEKKFSPIADDRRVPPVISTKDQSAVETPEFATDESLPIAESRTEVAESTAISDSSDKSKPAPVMEAESIETQWGGIFYLLNVGLYLNLYSDFTSPLNSSLTLSIWDFIAFLGQSLAGSEMCDDPVWKLLAELSGRGESPPGDDFDAPLEWQMPVEWLLPFADDRRWQWVIRGGRLLVAHPAGFVIADMPASSPGLLPVAVLPQYADQLSKAEWNDALEPCSNESALARWLQWLVPYVRLRLCLSTGISSDQVGRWLLQRWAKVQMTSVHLDITFSLDSLPVEIRRAGLDRNPGWVPAAGRIVTFHYQ